MTNSELLLPVISGCIGALIGTYFGSYLLYRFKEKKIEKVRAIAKKALTLINGYAKEGKTYDVAANDFNNKLTIADKRAVLVALHKIGIPVEASTKQVNISKVNFQAQVIDKDVILGMIGQVDSGLCDHLFFNDIESYFSNNLRLNSVREVGKKYVQNVLAKSKFETNDQGGRVNLPDSWDNNFTQGEINIILVLANQLMSNKYFQSNGSPDTKSIELLISEIEIGLWDNYLFWEYEAYANVKAQKEMSQMLISQINIPQLLNPNVQNAGSRNQNKRPRR